MKRNRHRESPRNPSMKTARNFLRISIFAALFARGENSDDLVSHVALESEAACRINAQSITRPNDAEAPCRFATNLASHAVAYNLQAPSVAIVPLHDGHTRVWAAWYQQNNNPGGSAIGGGSFPHCVYAYCDDPFDRAEPVWLHAVCVEPVAVHGDESASDPEVSLLPDGNLLCSYITVGPGHDRKRSTYAFLVRNPATEKEYLNVGRQNWLGYGVLSQPFRGDDGQTYAVIDEWSVARRLFKLQWSANGSGGSISTSHISDILWPGHPALTIFFEDSVHAVSGGRFRAYRRTKDGVYTTLSEAGGLIWGTEEKWTDHRSVNSRSAFSRSPYSGRVIGAVNCPPEGVAQRTDLTLVVSEAEGAPGTFNKSLNIEPDTGQKKIASQYPRVAFDPAGNVYCIYRWSDSRAEAPHNGAAIMLARVREDRLVRGATLADVEKRVVMKITPSKSASGKAAASPK